MPNPGEQWWPTMTGDPPTTRLFEAIRPRPMSASEFYAPVKALRPTFEAYGGDALWNPDTKRWGEGTVGWDDPEALAQAVEARRSFAAQNDSEFFQVLNQWAIPWHNKAVTNYDIYAPEAPTERVSIVGTPGLSPFEDSDPRSGIQPEWLLHHENYPGYVGPDLGVIGQNQSFKNFWHQNYGTIDWMTQPGYQAIEGAYEDPRAPAPGWDVSTDLDKVSLPLGRLEGWQPYPHPFGFSFNQVDPYQAQYSDPGSPSWVVRTDRTSLDEGDGDRGFQGGYVQDPWHFADYDDEGNLIEYPDSLLSDIAGTGPATQDWAIQDTTLGVASARSTNTSGQSSEDYWTAGPAPMSAGFHFGRDVTYLPDTSDFLMPGSEYAMTLGEAHSLAQRKAAQEADRLEQRIEQLGLIEAAGGQEAYAALGQLGVSRQAGGEMGEAEHAQLGPNAFLASSILGTGTQAQAAQVGEQVTTEQRQEGFLANTLFDEEGLQAERAREAERLRLQGLAAGEEALGGAVQARSAANQYLTGQRAGTRLLLG